MSELFPRPRRIVHYTPLRYPGGKGKLAAYVKRIMRENRLLDGHYVEPYAGGAAVALELLFHEYAATIHINDISKPVFSFWTSVLDRTEELCRLISDTPRSIEAWDRQKKILTSGDSDDPLALGFAMFFLNRTNRSGILNAGVIGGRNQTGEWKIDARYNSAELIHRVQSIARLRSRIQVSNCDAVQFLEDGAKFWPIKTLIYLDPPYYRKGRDLYYDFYCHEDHVKVSSQVIDGLSNYKWIVSYDNEAPILNMYEGYRRIIYDIGYSARSVRKGSEVMFFSPKLDIPALVGSIKAVDRANLLPVPVSFDADVN